VQTFQSVAQTDPPLCVSPEHKGSIGQRRVLCGHTDVVCSLLDETLFVYRVQRRAKLSVCLCGFVRGKKRFVLCNAYPRDILFLLESNYSGTTYYVRADSTILSDCVRIVPFVYYYYYYYYYYY
jgi:hypothetical protein